MMTLKLAWRNLWRNRRRTYITMASVFFAVLLAIAMRSLQEGTYAQMINNVVSFYSGSVQVHAQGYWDDQSLDLSMEQSSELETKLLADPQVTVAGPRLESFALISFGEESASSAVVGIDPELEDGITGLRGKLVDGSYLDANDQGLLLAEGLAEKLSATLGDTLVLLGQGYHGVMAAGKYPIQGILSFGSPDLNKRMLYLPLKEAQVMYGAEGRLTSYVLGLNNPQSSAQVVSRLETKVDSAEHEVMEWSTMMPELVQTIESDRAGGVITVFILYVIIGFGIFGTILMMTTERQYEFGVLTAIGMKRGKLAFTVLVESVIIAMLGVLAGSAIAFPIVWYLNRNPIYMGDEMAEMYAEYGMDAVLPTVIDPVIFSQQAMTVLIITLVVSLYPLFKIRRLDAVKAMRV